MISNKTVAAHILRLYAWEMLRENGALSKITVGGIDLIPIIPVEDEPEFRDSGKAYIIYGWAENEESNVEGIKRGNLAFRIIAEDSNQLSYITSILSKGLCGEDVAAESVNWWSSSYQDADFIGIRFTWIDTILIESADPAIAEGGQVEGNVMVGYRYVSSQHVKTYKPGAKLNGSDAAWA
jgi:hypothetical protein